MLLIQLAAAALLLLGSWLIFRALLEIDAPTEPRSIVRSRPLPDEREADIDLPRAA